MATPPGGPRPRGHERAAGVSDRAYRLLLRAYPRGLREGYGDEMARCFRDLCREELQDGGVALAAAFILVWASLGVGIIGADGDPTNLMYFGVLAVGIVGALIARFRPHGMARALFATAFAQASVALIALIFGLGSPWSGPVEILALNGFFVALFVGSALLFGHAGRGRTPAGAGQEG